VTDAQHVYTNTLDYPETFAYLLFAAAGVLSVLTFICLKYLNKYVSDFNLVLISSILGLVGFLIVIDYTPKIIEPARFIIGFCVISVTFPFGRGVTLSLFSKLIGDHKAGTYMGWMLAIGAISRIIGPFWSVQALGVSPALTFGLTAALFLVNILLQIFCKDSLQNHWSVRIKEHETREQSDEGNEEVDDTIEILQKTRSPRFTPGSEARGRVPNKFNKGYNMKGKML